MAKRTADDRTRRARTSCVRDADVSTSTSQSDRFRATGEGRTTRGRAARRVRRAGTRCLIITMGVALILGLAPVAASAAPKTPVIPSQEAVRKAQQAARSKAADVASIERQLAAAQSNLQTLQIASQLADQRYGNALETLAAAKVVLAARQHDAQLAQAAVQTARTHVGELARSAMESHAGLLQWATIFNGGTPQQIVDSAGQFNSVSTVMRGRYDQLKAAEKKAAVAQAKAAAARTVVQAATDRAAAAKKTADAATTAQQTAVAGYGARRATLIAELARAQKTSVAIARQRQEGLEAQARARRIAAAKAREAALRRKEAAQAAEAARKAAAERAARAAARRAAAARAAAARRHTSHSTQPASHSTQPARSHTASQTSGHSSTHTSAHSTQSSTHSSTHTSTHASHSSGGNVDAVIAYARRQIGKPYVFGADGPNSFDCSGLTMRAWEAGGKEIGHYTGIQWGNVSHISIGQLRRGDLVFWATDSSDPSTIYHTALYIGGGEIIEAPSPGRDVKYSGLYDWITPNFFGRP